MKQSSENIQKLEVILDSQNLEVVERIKTIKSLMDAVIDDSIIEKAEVILDSFNRLLNGDFDFLERWLNEMYPLFEFEVEKSIIITWTAKIDNCRSVPSFVTNLTLYRCKNLTSLEGLPKGLKSLEIEECDNLITLKGLPEVFESLEIYRCKNVTSLEGLPDGLEELKLWVCDDLTSLEGLPGGLKSLNISECEQLESLEGLPAGLQSFEMDQGSKRNLDGESLKMLERFRV